jgi:hypothetical protein
LAAGQAVGLRRCGLCQCAGHGSKQTLEMPDTPSGCTISVPVTAGLLTPRRLSVGQYGQTCRVIKHRSRSRKQRAVLTSRTVRIPNLRSIRASKTQNAIAANTAEFSHPLESNNATIKPGARLKIAPLLKFRFPMKALLSLKFSLPASVRNRSCSSHY